MLSVPDKRGQAGFSFWDVILSAMILGFVLIFVVGLFTNVTYNSGDDYKLAVGEHLAREKLEQIAFTKFNSGFDTWEATLTFDGAGQYQTIEDLTGSFSDYNRTTTYQYVTSALANSAAATDYIRVTVQIDWDGGDKKTRLMTLLTDQNPTIPDNIDT